MTPEQRELSTLTAKLRSIADSIREQQTRFTSAHHRTRIDAIEILHDQTAKLWNATDEMARHVEKYK